MPNMRLGITNQDRKAMLEFFTNRTYQENSDYLKIVDTWKTTSEINKKLNESGKRTIRRLERLSGFGLLTSFNVPYKNRVDNFWMISREGVYYILANLDDGILVTRKKQKSVKPNEPEPLLTSGSGSFMSFLKSNQDRLDEFADIMELVQKRNIQVHYLTDQIEDIVTNHRYSQLENFIENWRGTNIPMMHSILRFRYPEKSKVLKRVYGEDKEMMEKLSHTYRNMG